jgi:hypothetical protein
LRTATPFVNVFFIESAIGRAMMSTMPPAGYATTIVRGRSGYSAAAGAAKPRSRAARSAKRRMGVLPF